MNSQELVESVVADQLKEPSDFPTFGVGDTLNIHFRIIEGGKERIQVYQGVLIATKGTGVNRTITVRRIVANEGVEKTRGQVAMAAERSVPPRNSEISREQVAFMPGVSDCSSRTSRDSRSEIPALIIVESCRVKRTRSCADAEGRALKRVRPPSPPFFSPLLFFLLFFLPAPSSTRRTIRS